MMMVPQFDLLSRSSGKFDPHGIKQTSSPNMRLAVLAHAFKHQIGLDWKMKIPWDLAAFHNIMVMAASSSFIHTRVAADIGIE